MLSVMDSANTDSALHQWLRWASEHGNTPMFVRTVAEAALIACSTDYVLLRPVLVELKRRQVAQGEDLQLQSDPRPGRGTEDDEGGNQQTEHRNESLPAEPRQYQLIQHGPDSW
jgi:hypothetical protein